MEDQIMMPRDIFASFFVAAICVSATTAGERRSQAKSDEPSKTNLLREEKLKISDVGMDTQAIEQDIIDSLQDIIRSLNKR
jgi:hypothetical protein